MRVLLLTVGVGLCCALSRAHGADCWPGFLAGARSQPNAPATLPTQWDLKKNVAWSVEIPGRGWSSPVVWKDRIFVTSVVSDQPVGAPRKGLYIDNLNGKVPTGDHRWLVSCLDFSTGKVLWQQEAHKGKPATPIHVKNTFASETPVVDEERVYAYFGNLGVFCFDHAGKLLWSKKLDPLPTRMGWGTAASPVLHKDRLFVVNDNEKKSYLLALEAKTGKELWRLDRPEKSNWATPFVWDNNVRTELITAGSGKIRSYDLEGKLLWELGGMSVIAIPTPFTAHGLLYVTSGYVIDTQKPLYAIRPGASGDITLARGETSNRSIAWCQKLAGPYHPTPLVHGDYLYVLYDRGQLSCYEAKTGKEVYTRKRLEGGSAFTASPWAYGDKIFCLSEEGDTYVVQAGKEFKVLHRCPLEDMTLATPAMAHGSLLIRTMSKLYRLEEKK